MKINLKKLPVPLKKAISFLKTPLFLLESEKIVVGLDVGSDSVKIAILKDDLKHTQLLALGMGKIQAAPTAAGPGTSPETAEPGAPEAIDQEALTQAIKDAVLDSKQKAKTRIVSAMKKDEVLVRTINVVYMPEEELDEGIRWEAEQYIPFPMTEALLDYMVLGDVTEAGVDKLETLVVAAQRRDVTNFVDLIARAELSLGSLSLESLGLWHTFAKNTPVREGELIALINIGNRSTNITIFDNGKLLFAREIPLGGANITRAIEETLGLSFSEAEELKKATGIDEQSQIYAVVLTIMEQLSGEIIRSFDFFRAQSSRQIKEFNRVVLAGGTALLKNIQAYLSESLGMNVELINAFKNIEYDNSKFDENTLFQSGPIFSTAIGLALMAKRPKTINILPPDLIKGKVTTLKDLYPKLIAGGIILIIIMTYLPLFLKKQKYSKKKATMEKSKEKLTLIAIKAKDLEKKREEVKKKQEFIQKLQEKHGRWSTVLSDLGRIIPEEVWLTAVSLIKEDEKNKLKILGSSATQISAVKFLLNLKLQPYFNNVVLEYTKTRFDSGERVVDFEIIAWMTDEEQP